jgi:hypothetical protein
MWLNAGDPFPIDPFYERAGLLTPSIINRILLALDIIMSNEIKKYPVFHNDAQGIDIQVHHLVVPEFKDLGPTTKLAIVMGIDRIFQKHRMSPEEEAEEDARKKQAEELAREVARAQPALGYDWSDWE